MPGAATALYPKSDRRFHLRSVDGRFSCRLRVFLPFLPPITQPPTDSPARTTTAAKLLLTRHAPHSTLDSHCNGGTTTSPRTRPTTTPSPRVPRSPTPTRPTPSPPTPTHPPTPVPCASTRDTTRTPTSPASPNYGSSDARGGGYAPANAYGNTYRRAGSSKRKKALGVLVIIAAAVVVPVYFLVIKKHNDKAETKDTKGAAQNDNERAADGRSREHGHKGGRDVVCIQEFVWGYWASSSADPFLSASRANSWTPPLNETWD
ncbi:hypothetical protein C8J57DRAFT_1623774 [Mycena rebaudengoi]|nr:hypothetical protein C8J57DRAFT_1623774 [Mycena rebaudengoi]